MHANTAGTCISTRQPLTAYVCTCVLVRHNSVAASESVIAYLYALQSQQLQAAGQKEPAMMYVSAQRYGRLLDRLLSAGCRAVRLSCLMVHGDYVPPHRYVYCPSIIF